MARHEAVAIAAEKLDMRPYMAGLFIGELADDNHPDGHEIVPLFLSKSDVARTIVALMNLAVVFDEDHAPTAAVDALAVAGRLGDQAFLDGVEEPSDLNKVDA